MFEVIENADQYDKLSRSSGRLLNFASMINGFRERAENESIISLFDEIMNEQDTSLLLPPTGNL